MAPRTPPPFDQFQPFSFAKIPFPYETYSVTGGIRKHKHEYPHSDGGAVEKLGRELYEIHVSVNFTAGLVKQPYEELLNSLAALRSTFEEQTTDALVIPHIGVHSGLRRQVDRDGSQHEPLDHQSRADVLRRPE